MYIVNRIKGGEIYLGNIMIEEWMIQDEKREE